MVGVSVFIFIVSALCAKWSSAQYLNHRPYPTYSLEDMPDTGFSCRDKILGGYYADSETQCQMFHVCVKVSGVGVQDFRFLCSNGTAFDQDHQICADWQDVDCDATTLYYSSDNFDLYRIGSGFESKAVKYGEDEEPFSLQRAETGDVRINREHQSQRINQQRDFNYRTPTNNHHQQNNNANRNSYNNNSEKDIFKGSSSSSFFNNRNGGKENDDDEYESANVNANQDNDQNQKRKSARGKQNRRPNYENQTEKPRSTGFVNNFAGSSYLPTTTTTRPLPTTTENVQYNTRGRQRGRVSPQYNNADNFRQSTNKNYEDDGRYRGENYYNRNPQTTQYTVSSPTPFQQNPENSTPKYSSPTTYSPQQRSTENYPSSYNQPQQKYNNNQNTPTKSTENYPITNFKKTENYPTSPVQPKESEIYRNNPQGQQQYYNDQYETTKVKPYENYPTGYNTQNKKPTTPIKQTDNYPTTYAPKISKDYKNIAYTEQSSTPVPQTKSTYNQANQQTSTYNKQNTQYTPTINYHHQQYDHSRTTNTQIPNNHQQYDSSKTTNTQIPNNQQYDNSRTTNTQTTNNHQQYDSKVTSTKPTNSNQQYDNARVTNTQTPNNHQQYDSKVTSTRPTNNNQQYDNARVTNTQTPTNYQQFDNSRPTNAQPTNNLPQNFKQTPLYNPVPHPKQTTQYTQYTPTVPRITTPYYTSTTAAAPRRSNRFDETQYDDGSYNSKYDHDEDKNNKEDEFLKTAHSINFASSRNEYIQNIKNAPVSTTQKPRPFSVTPNSFKSTELLSTSNTANTNTQNTAKYTATINKSSVSPPVVNTPKKPAPAKKVKDVSYDYAYYDTNVGSDHDYEIAVDIEKSDKLTSKKQ